MSNFSDDTKSSEKGYLNMMGNESSAKKSIDGTGRQLRRFWHDDNITRTATGTSRRSGTPTPPPQRLPLWVVVPVIRFWILPGKSR